MLTTSTRLCRQARQCHGPRAAIKLLETSNPSKESPLAIYALSHTSLNQPLFRPKECKYKLTLTSTHRRPATSAIARIIVLSPLPVIVALLIDPRIMNSGLGHLALAAVLVCDVLNVIQILGSTTYRIYTSHFGVPVIILTLIESLLVTIASAFSRVTFLKVIQLTPEGKPVKNYYISLICSGVLVSAIACYKLACSFILPHLLTSTVHSYILCNQDGFMILPCAIKMDLAVFYDFAFLKSVLVNVSVVAASKLLGVCGAAMLIKVPIRDAVNLCIIMATQGIVQGALYESIYKLQAHIV
ncbi:hypothetical protein POM88_009866 [Heracleum sosnowskyi]|uniref:Uncharacterized protein n=1 Tax=Heracleum sosnowskyi TaxID=360622 RepID=A0AAD8JBD8_9APIA|nr:hypothetical protein POM88_009866 [Heracleum sosnowskyi]